MAISFSAEVQEVVLSLQNTDSGNCSTPSLVGDQHVPMNSYASPFVEDQYNPMNKQTPTYQRQNAEDITNAKSSTKPAAQRVFYESIAEPQSSPGRKESDALSTFYIVYYFFNIRFALSTIQMTHKNN